MDRTEMFDPPLTEDEIDLIQRIRDHSGHKAEKRWQGQVEQLIRKNEFLRTELREISEFPVSVSVKVIRRKARLALEREP